MLGLARFVTHGSGGSGPSLNFNFVDGSALSPQITFTRASTATFTGSNGLIQSAAIDAPRFDYDPVTLAAKGLLIEEQRTNLLTYSEDLTNVVWTPQQVTVSANAGVAPDGTNSADKIAEDNTTAVHRVIQSATKAASAITYAFSAYIKAAERDTASILIQDGTVFARATINLATGALTSIVGSATATNEGNGWWRISVSGTSGTATSVTALIAPNNFSTFAGTTGFGVLFWGAQLEAGSFPTSYIPTVASQVTRSADAASVNTLSPWYNAAEGTLYAEYTASSLSSGSIAALNDGTFNNRTYLFLGSGLAIPSLVVTSAGTAQASISNSAITVNTVAKTAGAYAVNNFAIATNAGSVATDVSGALPTSLIKLDLGQYLGVSALSGHLRRITYYPRRLPDATLQQITS